jgi:hypothetical protein
VLNILRVQVLQRGDINPNQGSIAAEEVHSKISESVRARLAENNHL